MTFIEKLEKRIEKVHSLLSVGLDPDFAKLPTRFATLEFPQFEFTKSIIDATHEYASVFKLHLAFFEARGDQGVKEAKMSMDYLKERFPDVCTICDSKRTDIAYANTQYASAIFDWFGFDALTLHPYFGREALEPFLERKDKGCIIICRTSNPGAKEFQDMPVVTDWAPDGRMPLYQYVALKVAKDWNGGGNCAVVVGATYPNELREVRQIVGDMQILIPGIGAQGGDLKETVAAGINSKGGGVIIHSSRAIIFAEDPGIVARDLRDEINRFRP